MDVYVFFHETCEIEKVPNSKLFDVSSISAVACVAKGNTTFDGVKTGEYGTFLNKGATAGASLGLLWEDVLEIILILKNNYKFFYCFG